jgi:succinyl-CoA synthetase beta subunit
MQCDIIAQGVIEAAKAVELDKPLVVRLEGTNVNEGKKLLADSGIEITSADSLADAAQKIVDIVAKN